MKYCALVLTTILGLASCGAPQRRAEAPVIRPTEVTDFHLLYTRNCSGCHGGEGKGGLTGGVGPPVHRAIAEDAPTRRITAEGVPGTAMPAFAQKSGGLLTEAQIDVVVRGIRARWARPDAFGK